MEPAMKNPSAPLKNHESAVKSADAPEPADRSLLQCGAFTLDIRRRRLLRDGQVVALTQKPLEVLIALVQHQDRVLEKEELLRMVWGNTSVGDESLTQTISGLRKALGDTAESPDYILTVPRVGYRFIAKVRPVAELAVSPAPESAERPTAVPVSRVSGRRAAMVAAAATLAAVAFAVTFVRGGNADSAPSVTPVLFDVHAPAGYVPESGVTLSPDGRHLAFVVRGTSGQTALALRSLNSRDTRVLEDTRGANSPFWSPDSTTLAFFAEGRLKKIATNDRTATVVATIPQSQLYDGRGAGGAWSPTGIIVFAPNMYSGIYQVPDGGGEPRVLLAADLARRDAYRWPVFLPDGRRFLFEITGYGRERRGIYVSDLNAAMPALVLAVRSKPLYAAPGFLLYAESGALIARRFDADRLELAEESIRLVATVPSFGEADDLSASVAGTGALAYISGGTDRRLAWATRDGQIVQTFADAVDLSDIALSTDETRVLAARRSLTVPRFQLWLLDLTRGVAAPWSDSSQDVSRALWSPDGNAIIFASGPQLYRRPAAADSGGEAVATNGLAKYSIDDWANDGRSLVYTARSDGAGDLDVWVLPLDGGQPARPLIATPDNESGAEISPDGRWIAYSSDESGDVEVYVQRFPTGGDKTRVSVGGGREPRWRGDGRELFYRDASQNLVAATMTLSPALAIGRTLPLFKATFSGTGSRHYQPSADGQRFLINAVPTPQDIAVTVALHWNDR